MIIPIAQDQSVMVWYLRDVTTPFVMVINLSIINSTVSTWDHFETIFHGYNVPNMSLIIKSLTFKYIFENSKQ